MTGAFCTLSAWEVEVVAGLIYIHLYLDKISRRHHLRVTSLPQQHIINFLLDKHHSKKAKSYYLSLVYLTQK